MKITKNTGKPHIILYRRDNGTETWMKADDFFVRHDLSHYALEKTLGYTTAFIGMLNKGMDVHDFENRAKRLQITITEEACYAENMANLFLMEATRGNFDNFNEVLASAFTDMKQSFSTPVLKESDINAVRIFLHALLQQWNELAPSETIVLNF